MIGVVLWTSAPSRQAVIWCDDHAALAYLAGAENFRSIGDWPKTGQVVELETEEVGELRCARNVVTLDERVISLPLLLKGDEKEAPREAPPSRGRLSLVTPV